jgi:tRNA(Ile)-lysidine synthase
LAWAGGSIRVWHPLLDRDRRENIVLGFDPLLNQNPVTEQRSTIYRRWSREMQRADLFRPGERVGVAVSGGPDSVLLLEFMKHLAKERGLALAVVHFNHHLRGQASDEDERFVEKSACEAGIEFIRSEADVAAVARERRRNLEETARQLRYAFFVSLVGQKRLARVATGHTANDQAETVLLRLVRGSGTRGLGAIYPKLETGIVRPFLSMTREEVETEIASRGLRYRIDSTNLETRFARNKVRLELLPWLAKELNPTIVKSLNDLAERAREDEKYLEQQAREQLRLLRTRSDGEQRIRARALADLHPAVGRRVIRQMIAELRGGLEGITHTHVEDLRGLARHSQSGKRLCIPEVVAMKEFDWLVLISPARRGQPREFSYPVRVPGRVPVPPLGIVLNLKIVTETERQQRYNDDASEVLTPLTDLDPLKLSAGLVLRSWRPGDRFRPWGSGKAAKLKDLLRQYRIPVRKRTVWPVLESGHGIVWVRGLPPAGFAVADLHAEHAVSITEEPYED